MDIEQLSRTKMGDYEIESLLGRVRVDIIHKALQARMASTFDPPIVSSQFLSKFVIMFFLHFLILALYTIANPIQTEQVTFLYATSNATDWELTIEVSGNEGRVHVSKHSSYLASTKKWPYPSITKNTLAVFRSPFFSGDRV